MDVLATSAEPTDPQIGPGSDSRTPLGAETGAAFSPGSPRTALGAVGWTALMEDTGSPVLVVDAQGRIAAANRHGAELLGIAQALAVGRNYSEFYAPAFATERLGYFRSVVENGTPLLLDGMVSGVWHRTSMRPVADPISGDPLILVVHTQGERAERPVGAGWARSRVDDLGPLSVLTSRELDILRLIGDGLSTAEIAKELHRSVKTIEWHRVSLGTKLKVPNRVGLARIAIRAGLSRLHASAQAQAPEAA